MNESTSFWFPAKKYGWGWGLPTVWQGWVVFGIYGVLMVIGSIVFPPTQEQPLFILYTAAISAVLAGVCYAKGEPPGWHWGNKD